MDVQVSGIEEAIREAQEINDRLRQQRPAMDEVAAELKRFMEGRFAEREAPDGSPWLPVTLQTALYRDGDGLGLMRSRFARPMASRVRYGAKASFADVHQLGDGRVPSRPFAPVEGEDGPTRELVSRLRADIERWVLTGRIGGG